MELTRVFANIKKLEKLMLENQDDIIKRIDSNIQENEHILGEECQNKEKIAIARQRIEYISKYIEPEYIISLFIIKCNLKLRARREIDKFDLYIEQSNIFSLMYSCISNAVTLNIILPYNDDVKQLYEWCIYYFYVSQKYNFKKNGLDYENDKIYNYFYKIKKEAMFPKSMYNYDLMNEDFIKKIKEEKKDYESLLKKISNMNIFGISNVEETKKIFDKFCKFKKEGYYFFDSSVINHIINIQLKNFIIQFSNRKIRDTFSIDNALIFATKFKHLVIIDFEYMYYVHDLNEKSLLWGHYEKLSNNIIRDKDKNILRTVNRDYNFLLNYYLADHLEENSYNLPYDGKKYPTIGVKKIKKNKIYGDIDVLAYSPYTKNILNIEYKNYQMTVQNEYYVESEKKRVIQDKVYEKIKKREEQLRNNINDVCDLLGISSSDVSDVKSILITTRLNLCLYMEAGSEEFNCDYYAWYEFYQLVKDKKL